MAEDETPSVANYFKWIRRRIIWLEGFLAGIEDARLEDQIGNLKTTVKDFDKFLDKHGHEAVEEVPPED